MMLKRKSEGTILLELEHLKADNQRLLRLLKSTKEVILNFKHISFKSLVNSLKIVEEQLGY